MEFESVVFKRQSCRGYLATPVSDEIIEKIINTANLAPSACNGQPYYLTVCRGDAAKEAAKLTSGMGLNKFATEAPCVIVISEKPYVKSAAVGSKIKNNDYRSIDIGIVASYITLEAANQGLGSCILGWFDEVKLQKLLNISERIRLVITLGYPKDETIRPKKRKEISEISNF